jgi:hypothetical protein
MKRLIKTFAAFSALAISSASLADVICPFQVGTLSTTPDGWISISLNSGTYWKNWWLCPTSGSTTVNDGYSASRVVSSDSCKTIYTQLVTAKATGRRIYFFFHGPADCASASLPADGSMTLWPSGIALVD